MRQGYSGKKATSPFASPGIPPLPRAPRVPGSVPVPPAASRVEQKICNPYGRKQIPRRSSSMSALPRYPSAAKHIRLPPMQKGGGASGPLPPRTDGMASSAPGDFGSYTECDARESPAVSSAAIVDLARSGEEVLQVGPWSVRRLEGDSGLVFLNEEEGRVEVQPPPQVLEALDIVEEDGEGEPSVTKEPMQNNDAGADSTEPELFPLFRRIMLGAKREVPLKMARDILDAIKEDVSIFEDLQKRFSDAPDEPALSLQEGLGEEIEELAMCLQPGEVSEVIGTEDGIQIIIRVQ